MRITPHDIRQQQFTVRMFRGFDPQEVGAFLEDVADDYEMLLKDNQLLKEQLAAQEERQRAVIEREKHLQDLLVNTQRLVEDMKGAAKREADLIVREAELRGEKQVEAARGEEARIHVEIQALKRLRRQLAEDFSATMDRYRRMLATEAELDVPDERA
jgi:cell division initiation protein